MSKTGKARWRGEDPLPAMMYAVRYSSDGRLRALFVRKESAEAWAARNPDQAWDNEVAPVSARAIESLAAKGSR